ncbi:MAG TPA: hypothetical protein VH352_11170 [Pseudonocardiaceae bacterium]|nr:hypothetical protein [Pseudonocardiaceae bacterium]
MVAAITPTVPPATITTAIAAEMMIFFADHGLLARSDVGTGAPHVRGSGGTSGPPPGGTLLCCVVMPSTIERPAVGSL